MREASAALRQRLALGRAEDVRALEHKEIPAGNIRRGTRQAAQRLGGRAFPVLTTPAGAADNRAAPAFSLTEEHHHVRP